jgi:F0F1-type ATP synthase membrane subunit a
LYITFLVRFSVLFFLFFLKIENILNFKSFRKKNLENLFGLNLDFLILRRLRSILVFYFIFIFAFVGYFSYRFALLGLIYFTFVFARVSWLRTLLNYFKREGFIKYISKFGDRFFQTLLILPIELAREISRPFRLTIRLRVNILVGHFLSKGVYILIFYFGFKRRLIFIFAIFLEIFVFLVQRFVFSILLVIYLNE